MMKRDACLEVLARHYDGQIVVAVYQAAFDWMVLMPDAVNYVSVGAMGQASSHGLGLALGCPGKKVIVLDGDGSLLMNLGSLVTIAEASPPNFYHFLGENGTYEANGAHPIPGKSRVSFAGFARAAGYAAVHEFSELADFESGLGDVLATRGPVFVDLKIEPGRPSPQVYEYIHSREARTKFKQALAGG